MECDLFLNADGTESLVHERYRDSAAGLEHMANIGPMTGPLSEVCTINGEIVEDQSDCVASGGALLSET